MSIEQTIHGVKQKSTKLALNMIKLLVYMSQTHANARIHSLKHSRLQKYIFMHPMSMFCLQPTSCCVQNRENCGKKLHCYAADFATNCKAWNSLLMTQTRLLFAYTSGHKLYLLVYVYDESRSGEINQS